MTWFKVDDGFWSNPKTIQLSAEAVAMWVRAGAYSCQHLTDGVIPVSALRLLGTESAAGELVEAGLWYDHETEYEFHDWSEYQETSDAVRQRREQARDRQRRAREASAQKRRESQGMSRVTDGVTHGPVTAQSRSPRPDPTRPDHKTNPSPSPAAAGDGYTADFLEWWQHYPRKQDKGGAFKAWRKLDGVPLEVLIAGADRYAADPNREDRFTKHPSTWLNARAWEDETPLPPRAGRPDSTSRLASIQALKQRGGDDGWTGMRALTS